jgi:hypothetical protein
MFGYYLSMILSFVFCSLYIYIISDLLNVVLWLSHVSLLSPIYFLLCGCLFYVVLVRGLIVLRIIEFQFVFQLHLG